MGPLFVFEVIVMFVFGMFLRSQGATGERVLLLAIFMGMMAAAIDPLICPSIHVAHFIWGNILCATYIVLGWIYAPAPTHTFEVTILFYKPYGAPLANTMIYYGPSEGQETNVLGTTDSQGKITTTNSVLVDQTLYFKSSNGRYAGSMNEV